MEKSYYQPRELRGMLPISRWEPAVSHPEGPLNFCIISSIGIKAVRSQANAARPEQSHNAVGHYQLPPHHCGHCLGVAFPFDRAYLFPS